MYFRDIDKINKGYILKVKVRSFFSNVGIQFNDLGFKLLLKAFSKSKIDFDYLTFLDFVDPKSA